ncbi:hypothetical protein [Planctobacterium marinum]|uniref:Flagellar hook-length control protein-like C-terminal domain-containing protein n=1 Tax=Planctobacterium marinum TaxID=1631968 RepID=A0AA48KQF2_9ALTE|nr:hypothetical protein MACH26_32320 [Planctobacterium marinum]
MSNVPPSGNIASSQLTASSNIANATSNNAFKTITNVGTTATVIASTNAQLTLNLPSGKFSVPAAKIPASLETGKAVSFTINPESSANLLDINAKYTQQRLALTPQQSDQVIQTILRNPGSLAPMPALKGTVLSTQANGIQVNVNGQILHLAVKNPREYQPGQVLKLELNSGTLGWESKITVPNKQETVRLPAPETQKLLQKLPTNNKIELTDSGQQKVRSLLNQITDSQIPIKFERVQFKGNHDRLVAHLDFGSKPIVSIPLSNKQSAELQALQQKPELSDQFKNSNTGKQLSDTSVQKRNAPATDVQQSNNVTYKIPLNKTPDVSPDIDKTIIDSQKQFSELKIKAPIAEIKISEQKALLQATNRIANQLPDQVSNSDDKQIQRQIKNPDTHEVKSQIANRDANQAQGQAKSRDTNEIQGQTTNHGTNQSPLEIKTKLSNSAQQILQTLKALGAGGSNELQKTIFNNIEKLLNTDNSKTNSPLTSVQGPTKVNEVFQAMRTLVEHTNKSGEADLKNLISAIGEINKSPNIAEGLKSHINNMVAVPNVDKNVSSLPEPTSIKHLLQTPALPVTPLSLVSAPSGGMVAGLINLLQVSLAARLNRTNSDLNEKISSTLSQLISAPVKSPAQQKSGSAGLKDLSQLEQKHNLVKLLGDLINQHSKQKLQNAERTLQGQENFYYVLPFRQSEHHSPPELLISREKPDEQEATSDKGEARAWLLTMKLSIGDLGELLTKTKVNDEALHVDCYTSNEELKNKVLEHLPLLKKRFDSLGLNLEIGRCERGNIPEHLSNNPYQILQTSA